MGYPGAEMIGTSIKLAQQNYSLHFKAIQTLVNEFGPDLVFPLMDLSVEANALGRYTLFPTDDSATVPKERFDLSELERLQTINLSCDCRVHCYVETVKLMNILLPESVLKGAYVTGPYTLAALIMGADDAAMATVLQTEALGQLCHLATEIILDYTRMLIAAGANVVCVLEPSAVMLGPKQFQQFSADYVKHISNACRISGAGTIYHICGNSMHLIEAMVGAEVDGLSLDSRETGIDLVKVVERVPEHVAVIGNVNPVKTMLQGSPDDVMMETKHLLQAMKQVPNFVLSTGCDLPKETPIENIHAFMRAGRETP
ncbi:uroporphyrinogen decarboxylase (URO-D) [bacterium]|nr:uroporphyrinogen decarboxylase (URO-D) [bacterium]